MSLWIPKKEMKQVYEDESVNYSNISLHIVYMYRIITLYLINK
jgi:hypothetical protein